MPPGREKDSSDRFHPATRKASTTARTVSIYLAPSPSYRQRFFLAFETGSGARTMVFTIVRPGVPRENALIVRDQTRFLRFARGILFGGGVFTSTSRNLLNLYCHWSASVFRKQIRRDVPVINSRILILMYHAVATKIIPLQVYVKRASYTHVCSLGKRALAKVCGISRNVRLRREWFIQRSRSRLKFVKSVA